VGPEVAPDNFAGAIETARIIRISARQYEFSPDHLTLKRGEPVTLVLTTEDRKHGFLSDGLGIDADILPGKPTEITVTPQKPGTYTVLCDHYCGIGHEQMRMTIVVE
jgi:cytochrome c oxidase subunit 2